MQKPGFTVSEWKYVDARPSPEDVDEVLQLDSSEAALKGLIAEDVHKHVESTAEAAVQPFAVQLALFFVSVFLGFEFGVAVAAGFMGLVALAVNSASKKKDIQLRNSSAWVRLYKARADDKVRRSPAS